MLRPAIHTTPQPLISLWTEIPNLGAGLDEGFPAGSRAAGLHCAQANPLANRGGAGETRRLRSSHRAWCLALAERSSEWTAAQMARLASEHDNREQPYVPRSTQRLR